MSIPQLIYSIWLPLDTSQWKDIFPQNTGLIMLFLQLKISKGLPCLYEQQIFGVAFRANLMQQMHGIE